MPSTTRESCIVRTMCDYMRRAKLRKDILEAAPFACLFYISHIPIKLANTYIKVFKLPFICKLHIFKFKLNLFREDKKTKKKTETKINNDILKKNSF